MTPSRAFLTDLLTAFLAIFVAPVVLVLLAVAVGLVR